MRRVKRDSPIRLWSEVTVNEPGRPGPPSGGGVAQFSSH
jgi:hypothetical protein